jgi:hypothetical protein
MFEITIMTFQAFSGAGMNQSKSTKPLTSIEKGQGFDYANEVHTNAAEWICKGELEYHSLLIEWQGSRSWGKD